MSSDNNGAHQMITRSKGYIDDTEMNHLMKLVEDYKSESEYDSLSESYEMETESDSDVDEDYHPNDHNIMRNNIYIVCNQPTEFENEIELDDNEDDDDDDSNEDDSTDDEDKLKQKQYYKYKSKLNEDEIEYFSTLSEEEKDHIIRTEEMIAMTNRSNLPLRFNIIHSQMSDMVKSITIAKLDSISKMDCANGEYTKIMSWITNLCKIPIGKYVSLPITHSSPRHEIFDFLDKTTTHFNENIYGHDSAKEQIVRIIAQWISNPGSKGNVIGIHGNPGVGKTTLVKDCICKSLNLPFQFIPLGGASDSSYLDGHNFTYEGSSWGKIVDCLMKSECMNPVLYFDELDKVSETYRGQELINALIHLTDPAQNSTFFDKYFGDVPFDLSKCLIIFTYNNDKMINPILKDRMIRIHTNDYTMKDKLEIATKFLIPEFHTLFSFQPGDIVISEQIMQLIIEKTEMEAGVRSLKRSLELIFSNINLTRMIKTKDYKGPIGKAFPIHVDTDSILPIKITKNIVDIYIKDIHVNESHHHLYT